jgi:glycerophosphoryl diester phosphodiesterase
MKSFFWIAVLLFTACSSVNQSKRMSVFPKFDKEGHRGCRGLMPENTLPAMMKAIALGVTTLEMDIVITADKEVILSHEPFFNHEITTRPGGGFVTEAEEKLLNIYKMNYVEVLKYDVGIKPHPRFPKQEKIPAIKPRLADVITAVESTVEEKKKKPFYNIETKCLPFSDNIYHPQPAELVELLMGVINEKGIVNRVIIQSFDFRTLQYLHQKYPSVKTAMLIEDTDKTSFENNLVKLGFTATIYSPHFSLVTEDLVKKCHDKKMKLIPWTVNDKATIDKLKKMGVDGIITDYPDLF